MTMTRLIALSALVAAGAVGGALAEDKSVAPTTSGIVQSVDPSSRTVVLNDGQGYKMAEEADMSTLRAGAAVAMSCNAAGANCMVTAWLPATATGGKPESNLPAAGAAEGAKTAGAAEGRHAPDIKQPGEPVSSIARR